MFLIWRKKNPTQIKDDKENKREAREEGITKSDIREDK